MNALEPSHEEKIALLPSDSRMGRMLICQLDIGEKAKICINNYSIYMQRHYLPKI